MSSASASEVGAGAGAPAVVAPAINCGKLFLKSLYSSSLGFCDVRLEMVVSGGGKV
jgi:hypothetical protein